MLKTLFLLAAVLLLCCPTTDAHQASLDKVVAAVQRLGGSVEFDETQKDKPIIKVDLHGTKVTDADLVILKDLKELRFLDLRLTHIGDAGVANLKNLKKLQTLNLFRSELTDSPLSEPVFASPVSGAVDIVARIRFGPFLHTQYRASTLNSR